MKTILITGCSSGFGLDTARYFLDRGWKVIATMRTPREDLLPRSENLRVLPLDVTDAASIGAAVEMAGPIDVLVNNAGVGALNALEDLSMTAIRTIYETNTLGTIALTQAFLPQFRGKKDGIIINVTSSVTLKSLPLLAAYTGSKAAVNAFTESLALELEPFNIRVRLVLPGRSPETSFGQNARSHMGEFSAPYAEMGQRVFASVGSAEGPVTHSSDVAEAIWRAATEANCPIRLPAGADAVEVAASLK